MPLTERGQRIGGLLGAGLLGYVLGSAPSRAEPDGSHAGVLAAVIEHIRTSYLEDLGEETVEARAARALAASLDPWSAWYPPSAVRSIEADAAGVYVGAGADTEPADCGLRVTRVVPDGPAEHAGLVAGDCVSRIDGAPAAEAVARLGAPAGTVLTVEIVRGGATRRVVLALVPIEPRWVVSEKLGAGAVYVGLRELREGAARRVRDALGPASTAVILDLRSNPGGILEEAVGVADLFLSDGEIVRSEGRGDGQARIYAATASPDDRDGRLLVLIDGGSASAAEVLAGALQARGRATLYGTPSYGKGFVQSFFHYADGSVLKLTTSRWRLPSGRILSPSQPVVPDVTVGADPATTTPMPAAPTEGWALSDANAPPRPARVAWPTTPIRAQAAEDPALAAALAALR